MSEYFTYILRCEDDTLYTGITTDIERRMKEHKKGTEKSAYTRTHRFKCLEAIFSCADRSEALKLEHQIKKLKKAEKEELIKNPDRIDKYIKKG